jgi:TetR/AcrR family transcriptional regulator, cholesterol catabolism regulator
VKRPASTNGDVATTRKGSSRRQELLEVAADLFSKKGYHATSMRDIAEGFGVLSGSLYSHIASKSELLYELVANVSAEVLEVVSAAARAETDPVERFRTALRAHYVVTARHMYMAKVALAEWRALEGEQREAVMRLRDDYEVLWTWIVEECVEAGVFKPEDVRLAVLTVLSVANWMYQWYRPDGRLSAEELGDSFATYLLDGLLVRTAAERTEQPIT